jgi:peptide/nickel transport system ATP-binding protein
VAAATEILRVEDLRTEFASRDGVMRAVDGVSLTLHQGETLGIVGESGCGKSVTALSILRLVDGRPGIVGGAVRFDGRNLLALSERAMREIRGSRIAMIFQEPMSSLNPVLTIGRQITEVLRVHERLSPAAARERAIEMLGLVQIAEPARRLAEYPHQLSGGMRQRVMIALALACKPDVLIADEPTTALDVTVQAQILALLLELQRRLGMAIILITHDLGVVAETCERAVVMYAGRKAEEGPVGDIFRAPLHPYTRGLLKSVPRLRRDGGGGRLSEIPGTVPSAAALVAGCAFAQRCPLVMDKCRTQAPPLLAASGDRLVACWRPGEVCFE